MAKCQECGKSHTNGSKFCTRKCRIAWRNRHAKIYKKYMKKNGKDPLLAMGISGRGVFDCDGNS